MKKIVVLKNDAIGDTMHSLPCINGILNIHKNNKIIFFLSKRNKDTYYFFKKKNSKLHILNYSLNLYEKLNLFLFFLINKIDEVYILAPKNFFFYLPFIFRNTKFYAVCVNNRNNKSRPSNFFRKFLYYYVVNDRRGNRGLKSIKDLQLELLSKNENVNMIDLGPIKEKLNYSFLRKYIFLHFKKDTFDKLGWDLNCIQKFLKILSSEFHLAFTTDIEGNSYTKDFNKLFNSYDGKSNNFINRNKNITFFNNFSGLKIFNLIANSQMTVGVHGSFVSLSSYLNIPTIDLFYIESEKKNEILSSRDAAREFSPFHKSYFKIIPTKNFDKLSRKVRLFLKYAR